MEPPSTLKTGQITPWLVFTVVFADVAVGPTCQSAGLTCQPPTLSFLSSSLSAAFLCSGTAGAALPPQPSSASAHRRRVPALRPQRAGHGGGGWQAAAAWSRVRPWRLLLEGTADELVASDKARHEEDQRGETHQVTRSAGSERAGGELATTGRRRPWRHGGAKCALVKPAVNTTRRHAHELREDTTNTPTRSVGGYGGWG